MGHTEGDRMSILMIVQVMLYIFMKSVDRDGACGGDEERRIISAVLCITLDHVKDIP